MSKVSNMFSICRSTVSRLMRGLLLIFWILALSYVALGSLTGDLATLLLSNGPSVRTLIDFRGPGIIFTGIGDRISTTIDGGEQPEKKLKCPRGDEILSQSRFRYAEDNPPPIDVFLDVTLPNWAIARMTEDGFCSQDQAESIVEAYQYLFSKVEGRLRSIARNESVDPKVVIVDATVLPPAFQDLAESKAMIEVKLPPEIQDWVIQERQRLKKQSQARALVGTFLLLSVLGAFGSLIFLIRDFISVDKETKLSDYVFRPVLGVFLAVAIFIVDILAHSVISTASILEIRYEPLYLLALGAGLLSERVYDVVRSRAGTAIARYEEAEKDGSEAAPHQAIEPDVDEESRG